METNPHWYTNQEPTRRPEDFASIPYDPRLDLQILQDLEEMNRQLLAELEVSSSNSSQDSTPTQDQTDLQDHPKDWLILDKIGSILGGSPTRIMNFKK